MMNYPEDLTPAQAGILSLKAVAWFLRHLTAIYGRLQFSVGANHFEEEYI